MKAKALLAAIYVIAASLFADTLRIGVFTLPYCFEDDNVSDIIKYVVTNDVTAYSTPITAFRPPYQDRTGNIRVQRVNTPSIIERSDLFNDGIAFYIESGRTNCLIGKSITDAAKAIENELPAMTNLVAEATFFVEDVLSGSITNRTAGEIRSAICYVRDGELRHPTTQEANDEIVRAFVAGMKGKWVPLPLCHLDLSRVSTVASTNTFSYLPVRGYDTESSPAYRHILSTDLVFIDGHWSFCVDGRLVFRNRQ